MSKIEKLTPAQNSRFAEFVARWTKIGLSTEPADRKRAERGIEMAYQIAGLKSPKFVWCDSPLRMAIAYSGVNKTASVRASVVDSVRDSVRDSVGDSVGNSAWNSAWNSVRDSVGDSVGASGYGQHDAGWLCFYEFVREVLGLKSQTEKLSGLTEIAKSAGWFIPCAKTCFVSERHSILNLDSRGRLHCDDGYAFGYPDGWGDYFWHGTRVDRAIVLHPESITIEKIANGANAELRRIMLERYDTLRYRGAYIVDSGAKVIHQDECGTLYRSDRNGDTPLLMVKVYNSTTESDNTQREFFLRVDPNLRPMERNADGAMVFGQPQRMTARNAVASSFGLRGEEYKPVIET